MIYKYFNQIDFTGTLASKILVGSIIKLTHNSMR
jgi:hypothetical protein